MGYFIFFVLFFKTWCVCNPFGKSPFRPVTVQVLDSQAWLIAAILDNAVPGGLLHSPSLNAIGATRTQTFFSPG